MAAVFTKQNENGEGQLVLFTYPSTSDDDETSQSSVHNLTKTFKNLLAGGVLNKTTHLIITGSWVFDDKKISEIQTHYGALLSRDAWEKNTNERAAAAQNNRKPPPYLSPGKRIMGIVRNKSFGSQRRAARIYERSIGIRYVVAIIDLIGNNLKSFTWASELPFHKSLLFHLPRGIETLDINLNVSSGNTTAKHHSEQLTMEDLQPLCEFRELRDLRIVGMKISFQPLIWEVVWLNSKLEELELGMAENPTAKGVNGKAWTVVSKDWYPNDDFTNNGYRGQDGAGPLDSSFGNGEYLDALTIRKARVTVAQNVSHSLGNLPILTLRLCGFVVDDMPFRQYFEKLECLELYDGCIDAGFTLNNYLAARVHLVWGGGIEESAPIIPHISTTRSGDVNILEFAEMMHALQMEDEEQSETRSVLESNGKEDGDEGDENTHKGTHRFKSRFKETFDLKARFTEILD
ncbi:uncharacterized protein K452DRAFT_319154 [Aplosporella prunicola CBS 121167]|uniref:Uncharacterized protein n=1 Tax=Aplosporella prunicola CBS 121167 TaxID=1176127 RepID=A0A6A6BBV0_9PEZI|nr:uncharacterized protein K452DRAFT_319154 [Aplosporella prunicola CBS 121167]KAF2140843.1 hypothetical protein K452DRAFT_319154 [Aplosporella prunicola CBS 121167]